VLCVLLVAASALAATATAPSPLPSVAPEIRAAFLGDSGTGDAIQRRVRDQLLRQPLRWVFFLGDNVYTAGQKVYFGPRFNAIYKPLRDKGAECHAALGNHDVFFCGVATTQGPLSPRADAYRIRDRGCDVDDQIAEPHFGYRDRRRYYSVISDAGPVPLLEVFVLDSNTLGVADTKLWPAGDDWAQVNWLDAALAASKARWKAVALHHPPHSPQAERHVFTLRNWEWTFGGRMRETRLDNQIAPTLRKRGVDAVFAGHNHFYARMVPQEGIRYFVTGGGGRPAYGFEPAPGYVAAGGAFNHFVAVRVTETRFEYYVVDDQGRSRDAGWFAKGDKNDHSFTPGTLPPPVPGR
jgi:calcineurin-like phosphoesterase family protein